MLVSRALILSRALNKLSVANSKALSGLQLTRAGHAWSYRVGAPPASKATIYGSHIVGGAMWWWVLWHLFHEYEHITGEFPYPDPSKWTNEELGIPDK